MRQEQTQQFICPIGQKNVAVEVNPNFLVSEFLAICPLAEACRHLGPEGEITGTIMSPFPSSENQLAGAVAKGISDQCEFEVNDQGQEFLDEIPLFPRPNKK